MPKNSNAPKGSRQSKGRSKKSKSSSSGAHDRASKSAKSAKTAAFGIEALKLYDNDSAHTSYDEESLSETSSYVTASSECLGDYSSDGENDVVETNCLEQVEEKLKDAVEGLTERSAKYRKECLRVVVKSFVNNDVSNFLDRFQETLCDSLEKCLKKGNGEEQALAAEAIGIVAIQLGTDGMQDEGTNGSCDNLFNLYGKFMIKIILDKTASLTARTKCCQVLGILAFLVADDMEEVFNCLSTFETLFKDSFLKGDKCPPTLSPLVSDMHNAALSAWALLLSICPWSKIQEIAQNVLSRLPELLTSSNVNLRMTAGETIALFFEIIQSEDAHHMIRRLLDQRLLITDLKALATDSSKSRSKKDKKTQRSNFRDIVRSIENDETPEVTIKFGKEILYIGTWTTKRQYSFLREFLGTGVNYQLKYNGLLRDVFELGPVMIDGLATKRGSHLERHLYNQAVFKARSKVRGKMRDKRTSFMY